MSGDPTDQRLLERVARGDRLGLDELLERHRARLLRVVELRLDRRVRGRVDASDVIQEACVEACQRLGEYQRDASVPFFVWLRFLAVQKLGQIHRRELGVQARDAGREVDLGGGALLDDTSAALAEHLVGKLTGPSEAALRAERKLRLQAAIVRLREGDREVLALRHFEQLSNSEIAHVLGISESAACRRYVRGLERLKTELAGMPGGLADWEP
jgi:RNA polymerase sigma-70 factor (ECF subfamily)